MFENLIVSNIGFTIQLFLERQQILFLLCFFLCLTLNSDSDKTLCSLLISFVFDLPRFVLRFLFRLFFVTPKLLCTYWWGVGRGEWEGREDGVERIPFSPPGFPSLALPSLLSSAFLPFFKPFHHTGLNSSFGLAYDPFYFLIVPIPLRKRMREQNRKPLMLGPAPHNSVGEGGREGGKGRKRGGEGGEGGE